MISTEKKRPFDRFIHSENIQKAVNNKELRLPLQYRTSILFRGTYYEMGDAAVLRQDETEFDIEFGKIILILFDYSYTNVHFIVEKLKSFFQPTIRFYQTRPSKTHKCINN